jgi:hypothetical protein
VSYVRVDKANHWARFFVPATTSSIDIGAQRTYNWDGVNDVFEVWKDGLPHLNRALGVGETVTIEDWPWSFADLTMHQSGGQSNGVGDAARLAFEAAVTFWAAQVGMTLADVKALIFPSTWIGGSNSGEDIIGPAQVMAALFAIHTRKPQIICDTATVTQSIAQLWGSNGNDGTYANKRDLASVFRGGPAANPPGIAAQPIRRFHWYAQGEADTSILTNATQPTHFRARTLDLLRKTASDFPVSPVIAHHVFVLGDTYWQAEANQPWLPYVQSELLSLANESGSETDGVPVLCTKYNTPSDWQQGDAPHIDAPPDGLTGWTRMGPIILADYLSRGWV